MKSVVELLHIFNIILDWILSNKYPPSFFETNMTSMVYLDVLIHLFIFCCLWWPARNSILIHCYIFLNPSVQSMFNLVGWHVPFCCLTWQPTKLAILLLIRGQQKILGLFSSDFACWVALLFLFKNMYWICQSSCVPLAFVICTCYL